MVHPRRWPVVNAIVPSRGRQEAVRRCVVAGRRVWERARGCRQGCSHLVSYGWRSREAGGTGRRRRIRGPGNGEIESRKVVSLSSGRNAGSGLLELAARWLRLRLGKVVAGDGGGGSGGEERSAFELAGTRRSRQWSGTSGRRVGKAADRGRKVGCCRGCRRGFWRRCNCLAGLAKVASPVLGLEALGRIQGGQQVLAGARRRRGKRLRCEWEEWGRSWVAAERGICNCGRGCDLYG